jgi:hypothetical protein
MIGMKFPLSEPAQDAGLVIETGLVIESLVVVSLFDGLKAVAPEQGPKTNGRGPPNRALARFPHHGIDGAIEPPAGHGAWLVLQVLGLLPGRAIRRNPDYLAGAIGMTFTLNRDLGGF